MANDSYDGYSWIKVRRYVMDESISWEARYRQLEQHHVEETSFLIDKVRELAAKLTQCAQPPLDVEKSG